MSWPDSFTCDGWAHSWHHNNFSFKIKKKFSCFTYCIATYYSVTKKNDLRPLKYFYSLVFRQLEYLPLSESETKDKGEVSNVPSGCVSFFYFILFLFGMFANDVAHTRVGPHRAFRSIPVLELKKTS